jgi:hypothetical protein
VPPDDSDDVVALVTMIGALHRRLSSISRAADAWCTARRLSGAPCSARLARSSQ